MFTPRQKRIIKYLYHQHDFTQVKTLSDLLNISERTTQYDLERIEDELLNTEAEVIRNKKKGVKIKFGNNINDLISGGSEDFNIYYSADERFVQILLLLFESLEPISTKSFSNLLNVSRRTIFDDLKNVHQWLEEHNLQFNYVSNKGFTIDGNEQTFRECYVEILIQYYKYQDIPLHLKYVGKNAVPKIYETVEVALNKADYSIIQSSLDGLVFHIAISLHRMHNNYKVEMPEEQLEFLRNKNEFSTSLIVKKEIEDTFNIHFPESEAGYIALHLLGARQTNENHLAEFEDESHLKSSIKLFLNQISRQMRIKIDKNQELIQGLMVHLKPAIYRLKYNFRNDNPLRDEIFQRYPEIVYAIEANLDVLEENFEIKFNKDEVAFIAIHIGAFIEKMTTTKNSKLNILLVCGSGVGTSQLLRTRIETYYPELRIIDVLSYSNLKSQYFDDKDIDFIVSTIFMDKQPVPVLNVTPFLNETDREKLNNIVNTQRENLIKRYDNLGPSLKQLLPSHKIKWDVTVNNWEEGVRSAVHLLSKDSIVSPDYANEIIEQFKLYGPYMVIGKNIALIHASSHRNVNRVGYSFVKLKYPIVFGHNDHDPVSYVICFATTSSKIHLNALRQLSYILTDENYMKNIEDRGKTALMEIINEISEI